MTVPQLPVVEYVKQHLQSGGILDGWRTDLELFNDRVPSDRVITIRTSGGSGNIELDSQTVEIMAVGSNAVNSDGGYDGVLVPRKQMERIKSWLIPSRNIEGQIPVFHFNVIGNIMMFKHYDDGRVGFVMNVECLTTRSEVV